MILNLQEVLKEKISSSKKPANPQNAGQQTTATKLAAEYGVFKGKR